ncbi:MAG TPA: CHAP domain-containing protein [Stellaceae bacterium]|jgi:surface antigen
MRAKVAWGLVWGSIPMIFVSLCARPATAGNCALYARAQTGVDLYGAAGGWWDEAGDRYWRGRIPQPGSILVFKRTRAIPSGHVAVVARVLGPREIEVDQANWYRGMVTRDVPVIDTSPDNDWTTVAVLDLGSGNYGRGYPSYGFVYPQPGPREIGASPGSDGVHPYLAATPTAYDPEPPLDVFHAAVAANDGNRRRNRRRRMAARGSQRRTAPAQVLHSAPPGGGISGRADLLARPRSAAGAIGFAAHAAPARPRANMPARLRAEAQLHHRG